MLVLLFLSLFFFFFFFGKLHIWSLSFTSYFNLASNILFMSIWSLTFQCRVNLVSTIIFWMEIVDVTNDQNKKLVYCHINGN